MFETNTEENLNQISLAEAARLTGYHQDYLGQLCRLGKLPAQKVGRNWVTTKSALQNLSNTIRGDFEEQVPQEPEQMPVTGPSPQWQFRQPQIDQIVTISEVDGLPVSMRTVPTPMQNTNNVQAILTALRIQELQQEVAELRSALNRLMAEVKTQGILLESQMDTPRIPADSLRHQYISTLDFNSARSFASQSKTQFENEVKDGILTLAGAINKANRRSAEPEATLKMWIVAGTAILLIIALGTSILSGNFFGQPQETQTTYYHPSVPSTNLLPTVAGDKTPSGIPGQN